MSDIQMTAPEAVRPTSPPAPAGHERRVLRNARLTQQLRDLVEAYTPAKFLGLSRPVEELAAKAGFQPHDLSIVEVLLGKRLVTILCVPFGGWTRPEFMERVRILRSRAKAGGHETVVVSQGIVDRQPRLGNASIIGVAGRRVTVNSTARMKVLAHLIDSGDCPLSELAALIAGDHADPYGAILNLVSNDVLRIDLGRVISPASLVGLPGDDDETE